MKYNELKEMTIKEWDGTPFRAYVTDDLDETIDTKCIETIVSFDAKYGKPWGTEDCNNYLHVYPIELNEDTVLGYGIPRMTNLQLAQWLAKGNGQLAYSSVIGLARGVHIVHSYDLAHELDECSDKILVREWGSSEWIEPTVDLLDKS